MKLNNTFSNTFRNNFIFAVFLLILIATLLFNIMNEDFNFYKLIYFDENGYIKSSTIKKEIGTKSKSKPFYEIVTKGNIYHKVVQKEWKQKTEKLFHKM